MAYATNVPVTRLEFSDGFNYYGAGTNLSASATVNLPVGEVRHAPTGETLTDGALIPAQDVSAFDVPDTGATGWVTNPGGHIKGWVYDLTVTITAAGQPTVLWSTTVRPTGGVETLTPGQGVNTATDAGSATAEHNMRVSELRRRVGRVAVTTKTAVTIVMDHGLNNFDAKVRPLLEARGIPVTLALNSQKWDDSTNNLVTAATVKTWADAGWLEPANHGRTHQSYPTDAANTAEIVDGRTELESQIGLPVDSWVQPGPFPAGGFDAGDAPEKYWTTHAGREILRSHAVATGVIPGDSLYPLDGEPVTGMKGGWIDVSASGAESAIGTAISTGLGYIVRFHPQYLDTAGYLTTAQLTAFLDQLVTWRDSGDITLLTLREFAVAEKAQGAPVDTGLVSLSLPSGSAWTSVYQMFIQRYGKVVTFMCRDAKQSGLTGSQILVNLPVGYRPTVNMYQDSYQGTRTWIDQAGNVSFLSPLAAEYLTVTYITQDPEPA